MKKKKKSLFDVESLAFPEVQYHKGADAEEEQPEQAPHKGKHHLRSKKDSVAVPEVEVDED